MFTIIKEFPNYQINENGEVRNIKFGRIMKPTTRTDKITGYQTKQLGLYKDKKQYCPRLHRLLAITFIPNPDNYSEVDHIDNNSLNNNLINLRWCPQCDNCQNRGVQKNNKIGIKNICYCKRTNRYIFKKIVRGKVFQEYFKTLDEAIECKNNWYDNNFSEFNRK